MSDYYYEIPLFSLFCCFSVRFNLKRLRSTYFAFWRRLYCQETLPCTGRLGTGV